MQPDEAIIIKKMDDNMATVYECWDNHGNIVVLNAEYQVINQRIWYTSTTYTSPIFYTGVSNNFTWTFKDCMVCGKPHTWIVQNEAPDHPYITDNLEYLEYKYEKAQVR